VVLQKPSTIQTKLLPGIRIGRHFAYKYKTFEGVQAILIVTKKMAHRMSGTKGLASFVIVEHVINNCQLLRLLSSSKSE
jgi:hypothetical protein